MDLLPTDSSDAVDTQITIIEAKNKTSLSQANLEKMEQIKMKIDAKRDENQNIIEAAKQKKPQKKSDPTSCHHRMSRPNGVTKRY